MTLARTLRPLASRHPQTIRIAGSFDLGDPAVPAELDMSTCNAQMDNVFQANANAIGVAGNLLTVTMVGDSGAGVVINRVGTDFTIHFQPGVSTQGDVNTAVTALAGLDDLFDVLAAGTVATVLQNGRALCDMDVAFDDADTIIQAGFNTGAAGNNYVVMAVPDGVGAGTLTPVPLGPGLALVYHFQDGVSTVTNFEAALAALVPADFELNTAGTGANTFDDPVDARQDVLAGGTAVHAEQAAASFIGGTDPVAPTSWRGMKECMSIAHPAAGRYVLSFRDAYPVILDFQATLQLITAAGQAVQVGAFSAPNGTAEVRLIDIATGALTDPVVAAGDRINVSAVVANTRMGRISTV